MTAEAVDSRLLEAGVGQRVRIIARLLTAERVSGQTLAGDLSMSRAGIHKHVEQLRSSGIEISSSPGSGYALTPPQDVLVPEAILPWLFDRWVTLEWAFRNGVRLGLPYHYLEHTTSTNEVLKRRALDGEPAGSVLVTDDQRIGKGRLGRGWLSQPGKDLTFSLLLRPDRTPETLRPLIFAATLGVAGGLASFPELRGRVSVKWPNDVLVDGGKVAGILGETSMDMDEVHWMVIGIGLNVNGDPGASITNESLPFGAFPPASISSALGGEIPRTSLLLTLLGEIEARLDQCFRGGDASLMREFQQWDALLGRRVRVEYGGGSVARADVGTAVGVGPRGEFLLRLDGGDIRSFEFGEASLVLERSL